MYELIGSYCYDHILIVPEDPPTNVEASAVSATTILLTWSEPLTPNGVIISFTISYSLFGSQEVIVVNNTESYLAAGLEADTVYVFELYASTRVGPGPSAQIQERTIESGKNDILYTSDFAFMMRYAFGC